MKENILVGILSGSASDKPSIDKITSVLDDFGVTWEYQVLSAHRTPKKCVQFVEAAESKGMKVLIAVAGLAAALPGVVAAHSILPVIGVPGDGGPLNGQDALYSIVQMPSGIPVATVGIGNGKNAGFLAVHILSLINDEIKQKLKDYRKSLGDL